MDSNFYPDVERCNISDDSRRLMPREPRILIGADTRQISFLSRLFPRHLRVMNFSSGGKLSKLRSGDL